VIHKTSSTALHILEETTIAQTLLFCDEIDFCGSIGGADHVLVAVNLARGGRVGWVHLGVVIVFIIIGIAHRFEILGARAGAATAVAIFIIGSGIAAAVAGLSGLHSSANNVVERADRASEAARQTGRSCLGEDQAGRRVDGGGAHLENGSLVLHDGLFGVKGRDRERATPNRRARGGRTT